MTGNYSIGLNIGTGSVGWAVVKDGFKVPSKKMKVYGNTCRDTIKKKLLGSFLFESGETAAGRRFKRNSRRSTSRRRNRILYLQEFFEEEISLIDPGFFIRLNEFSLVAEEKSSGKHLFKSKREESDYYKQFPTIYHLRSYLASADEAVDIRYIYLAIAHILKSRGHFLIEGELVASNSDLKSIYDQFEESFSNYVYSVNSSNDLNISEIFSHKNSRTARLNQLLSYFPKEKKGTLFGTFLSLALGLNPNFKKVFGLEEDLKLSISSEEYEADLEHLLIQISETYPGIEEVFAKTKEFHDAILLSSLLKNPQSGSPTPLSDAFIQAYLEHDEDLAALKSLLKKELKKDYFDFFSDPEKGGYAGYIAGKISREEFYKKAKKILSSIDGNDVAHRFIEKIEHEEFLLKQRSSNNAVIPHQIHLQELRGILNNQSKFYPFLKENAARIEKLLTFRIPYYVGPLANGNSDFAWLVRKELGKITPWNFDDLVDKEKSAEAFIYRMTSKDQYLPDESVLPKNSFIYQKFLVFNELTRLRFVSENGEEHYPNTFMKQDIFEHLFKTKRKVKKRDIMHFMNEFYEEYRFVDVIGLDENKNEFNSSISIYHDLSKILSKEFLDNKKNESIIEYIILTLSLFEDREIITQRLNKLSGELSNSEIKQLSRRKFSGWGRLSQTLISGIRDSRTGKTILDFLIDDHHNRNFMQLIHDKGLDFKSFIEEAQVVENLDDLNTIVQNIPGSPAIKKGILQSLKVVDEIIEVMGYQPDSIAIEMARETQTTKRGLKNSQSRFKKIQTALDSFGSDLLQKFPVTNEELADDKVYLYYLQNGLDMYTGQPLNRSELHLYHIDHIIPQSFIKDDSIHNIVLTGAPENIRKFNDLPPKEVISRMKTFWSNSLEHGLISKSKFDALIKAERGGISEEDKAGYIRRQLVETRQITKHVARILDAKFNRNRGDDGKTIRNVKVLTIKSQLVTHFRKELQLPKITELNDYHHAHDAYLTAVVGNLLLAKYPKMEAELVYGEYPKYNSYKTRVDATKKLLFYSNVLKFIASDLQYDKDGKLVWDRDKHSKVIEEVIYKSPVLVVKKVEVQSGRFNKETIVPKSDSDKLIPVKSSLDTRKYGGFIAPTIAYSILVLANKKDKKGNPKPIKDILGISIREQRDFEKNPSEFLENLGYEDIQLDKVVKLPKYSLFEFSDGRRRFLVSAKELQKANQLFLSKEQIHIIEHAKKAISNQTSESSAFIKENSEQVKELMLYILNKTVDWVDKDKVFELLCDKIETSFLIDDAAKSLIVLLNWSKSGSSNGFSLFGIDISRDSLRYTKTSDCLEGVLINQSVTGLYEKRTDFSTF